MMYDLGDILKVTTYYNNNKYLCYLVIKDIRTVELSYSPNDNIQYVCQLRNPAGHVINYNLPILQFTLNNYVGTVERINSEEFIAELI